MHHHAQDALGIQEHTAEHDLRSFGPQELAEAETASHVGDNILSSPDVREIESLKSTEATGQTVAIEVNTDQTDERDGGASWQRDENQLPTMDVTLDQKATSTATQQRAGTQLTTHNVAGHHAE